LDAWETYQRGLWHLYKYTSEDNEKAKGFFLRTIAIDPNFAPGHYGYALNQFFDLWLYSNRLLGGTRPGTALEEAQLAVTLDDRDAMAHAVLSFIWLASGEWDAAIAEGQIAINLNPNSPWSTGMLGTALGWRGHHQEGIAYLRQTIRISPHDPLTWAWWFRIGIFEYFQRDFEAALDTFRTVVRLRSSLAAPHFNIAAILARLGRIDEARAAAEQAQRLFPKYLTRFSQRPPWQQPENFAFTEEGRRLVASLLTADISWEAAPIEHGAAAETSRVDAPRDTPIEHDEAERRQLTALSCELLGVAAGPGGLDLDDLQETIGEFQRCISQAAGRHKGFIYRHLADNALVLFGYPEAHEHDAEQAVRAGLELCAAVRTLRSDADLPLRCRVGIATGLVIIGGSSGASGIRDHEIVGEAPNLAARLAVSAPADNVAIDPATRRLVGNLFDYRELGVIDPADSTAPMCSWQVLGAATIASRFEALRGSALSPLVGRDEEIGLLLRRWTRSMAGEGQIVLVSGEPGIGKSRIVGALEERLDAEPHLRLGYFCSPHHQDSALFPYLDQLGHAAGFAREDTPAARLEKLEVFLARTALPDEDVAFLADLLSLPASARHPLPNLSPQRKKERTLEALIHQLEGLACRQPVVVVFEDVHWIDPTSRELLDLMVEHVPRLPVLLIVTFRPEFQPPWTGQPQVSMLALNRLGQRDRTALVAHVGGDKALPDDVVTQIADRTDGVPLFVEELTKSVLESGLLREEADRWVLDRALPPFAIPSTLHDSLLARLDRLAPVRWVAQIGAAIGRQFSYGLLQAVAGLPEEELQAALDRLVASELVFQRGTPPETVYSFKHALVRDAAHGSLLRGPRQALHRRIAEALEQRSPDLVETQPEILAHHYGEAAIADKAITYWHLAGKLSVAKSAVGEAIAQLRRGLSLLERLPETRKRNQLELDLYVTLTAALIAGKGYADPEVVAALERANRLVTETAAVGTPLHISVVYGLWVSSHIGGAIAASHEHATNFLSIAQSQPSSEPLLVGHRILADSLLHSGDYRAALAHFETAVSLYRPDEHRDDALRYGQDIGVSAFGQFSWALWHRGYPDQSARAADRALAYGRELGHAHTLAYAFGVGGRPVRVLRSRCRHRLRPQQRLRDDRERTRFRLLGGRGPDSPGLGRRPKG
jgi:class 3 adenylate cyclase/Flp pilus assembly protein TadD